MPPKNGGALRFGKGSSRGYGIPKGKGEGGSVMTGNENLNRGGERSTGEPRYRNKSYEFSNAFSSGRENQLGTEREVKAGGKKNWRWERETKKS